MFFELGSALYNAFLQESRVAEVPADFEQIARQVAGRIGWRTEIVGVEAPCEQVTLSSNKKAFVALSGGLDSVYLMHRLIGEGYDVVAVHVAGLNKSSAKYEELAAKKAAAAAGVRFIIARFNAPRQTFPDNPFKNKLILSMMLDIGIKNGVTVYGVGSDWTTPLREAVPGFTITDSAEVYRAFWAAVKKRFPAAELVFIPDDKKKVDRLVYLFDKGALDTVSSCVAPLRFRASWHRHNEQKYRINLLPGRCGSCYKCAMEYILLVESGRVGKNNGFYAHCFDTLATSKTAHRPDLFAKSLPVKKRLENLLNYGS